jgi:hypothetical protein
LQGKEEAPATTNQTIEVTSSCGRRKPDGTKISVELMELMSALKWNKLN